MVIDSAWSPFPSRYRFDDSLARRTRECLLQLLQNEPGAEGVCPRDAARALASRLNTEWRDLMRPVRLVAAELAREGHLDILQDGKRVDILDVRGPVRLRFRQR
ncbi:uncharacterized protein DUF3253 [Tahibacter aquaticus]|uniref:Uncharacterized protein DUF3253 n=1 Tax=Tahibacter aquaticus TaxID=520092 RepID=A0A4R6Z9M6_9GAMM|nr:DUF3253 domain-containing protein [Tahibacter aquaticus]TDR48628.1 uncharacterized protein DUF3253 [Tahibacter aquaticus]